MKKKFWLLVAMVLSVLFLVACGNKNETKGAADSQGGANC